MRVHLGSDHAGFALKAHLRRWLSTHGHEPLDHGPDGYDESDDYPVYVLRTAEAVAADTGSLGVVIGGSGNGEAIAANKVRGVRAALAWNEETARLGREHNDANVLSLGARMHDAERATALLARFLGTAYSGDDRHTRRIAMLRAYEEGRGLPPLPGAR